MTPAKFCPCGGTEEEHRPDPVGGGLVQYTCPRPWPAPGEKGAPRKEAEEKGGSSDERR